MLLVHDIHICHFIFELLINCLRWIEFGIFSNLYWFLAPKAFMLVLKFNDQNLDYLNCKKDFVRSTLFTGSYFQDKNILCQISPMNKNDLILINYYSSYMYIK